MISDLDTLLAAVRGGLRVKYLHFWSHKASSPNQVGRECLSQWHPSPFVVEGTRYPTAEHFMMAEKARLFGDDDALAKVLQAPHPRDAKQAGREVQGFDTDVWEKERFDIVVRGNLARFQQNPELAAFLLSTGGRVLVEASPQDNIWGIGLSADDPAAHDPERWKGLNLLGFALTEVRTRLGKASPGSPEG